MSAGSGSGGGKIPIKRKKSEDISCFEVLEALLRAEGFYSIVEIFD
jgi:hypothetical protein